MMSGKNCLLIGAIFALSCSPVMAQGFRFGSNLPANPISGGQSPVRGYGANGGFFSPAGQTIALGGLAANPTMFSNTCRMNGSAYTCRVGETNCNFWRSSSGFYYPWFGIGNQVAYGQGFFASPIIYSQNGSSPVAKLPQPDLQLTDFLKYIDEALADNKLSTEHYQQLKLRAGDLQRKEKSMRTAQGSQLDPQGEDEIRVDIENLTKEMSERLAK